MTAVTVSWRGPPRRLFAGMFGHKPASQPDIPADQLATDRARTCSGFFWPARDKDLPGVRWLLCRVFFALGPRRALVPSPRTRSVGWTWRPAPHRSGRKAPIAYVPRSRPGIVSRAWKTRQPSNRIFGFFGFVFLCVSGHICLNFTVSGPE